MLRFIPELDIPVWLRAGKITEEVVVAAAEIKAEPAPVMTPSAIEQGKPKASKWDIVRNHVHAFQVPAGVKPPPNSVRLPEEIPFPAAAPAEQSMSTSRFRNYRRDTSTIQMIDPRRLMKARLEIARNRSHSSPNVNK